ncbi:AMIN domain-containing protein [Sulfurimonas lithotrophica]|uniref:N-acetylmuramoyl-L-alanine amidase n=1 Tax=Sulfurimonas lithotrophica TaxID=2590022 RepID=A0A5P8P1U0_9BACT|nr:N-acetylmuramoyl-L-alanine amidase [Sulfurimonas lithotrophica]QFR49703.1 AMIN domain-containing protein [Sulfurimonas lithotrophica]
MFRYLVLIVFFTLSLYAKSDYEVLKRADAFMKTGSKSDQFRAYNDYKNLYLRSLMNSNDKLRKSALEGIVNSGTKLHIDIQNYEDELDSMNSQRVEAKKTTTSHKTNKEIKIKSSHKLKNISWKSADQLVLSFDKRLRSNQVNYFTLYDSKQRRYRYVFDVHASMLTKSQTLRKDGINRIKIAQYNPSTLRLVIENDEKVKVNFLRKAKQLIIRLSSTSKNAKKYIPSISSKPYTPKRTDREKVIVIDPGHGGKDPGAVGYRRYREKIVVYKISRHLKNILKKRGYKVYMTRNKDTFIKLSKRTEYANKKKADIFISIHANAVDKKSARYAKGVECYFLSPSRSKRAESVAAKENSADMSDMNKYAKQSFLKFLNHAKTIASHKLAIDLQRGMLGSLNKHYKGVKDGGVREGPFWVLVGAQMPAVLVEVGFISHPTEARRLVDDNYRKKMAEGLADGIERYFANN